MTDPNSNGLVFIDHYYPLFKEDRKKLKNLYVRQYNYVAIHS